MFAVMKLIIEFLQNKEVMGAIVDTITLVLSGIIYRRQTKIQERLKN